MSSSYILLHCIHTERTLEIPITSKVEECSKKCSTNTQKDIGMTELSRNSDIREPGRRKHKKSDILLFEPGRLITGGVTHRSQSDKHTIAVTHENQAN